MGFMDKLKSVAKTASDKLADMQAEKEESDKLQALEYYGSIEGANIPEKSQYCLDYDNKRIVVRTERINNKHKFICEYKYDEVVELKMMNCTHSDYSSAEYTTTFFKIILKSGEELEISHILRKYKEKSSFNVKYETSDRQHIIDIILEFIFEMKDSETKKWLNTYFESRGLLPAFDENGEYSMDNMQNNFDCKFNIEEE